MILTGLFGYCWAESGAGATRVAAVASNTYGSMRFSPIIRVPSCLVMRCSLSQCSEAPSDAERPASGARHLRRAALQAVVRWHAPELCCLERLQSGPKRPFIHSPHFAQISEISNLETRCRIRPVVCSTTKRLLRLYACVASRAAEGANLLLHICGKLLRRRTFGLECLLVELLAHFRAHEYDIHVVRKAVGDILGHPCRPKQGEPTRERQARHPCLGRGRHVGQE